MRLLPSAFARPLAYRHAQKIAARYLGGNVRRVGGYLLFDVSQPVTLGSAPGAIGCTYYEASLHGLLSLLIGGIGSVEHVRCEERGERNCQWRADWRSVERGDGVG
jgi:hypothetical protein